MNQPAGPRLQIVPRDKVPPSVTTSAFTNSPPSIEFTDSNAFSKDFTRVTTSGFSTCPSSD
ncbi:hypothetical protein [Rubritalea tangerina]|uniref:hypothetical protein n=1 Tax=Rubritalea tangerina TaxID=430798 RepID=UPI0036205E54